MQANFTKAQSELNNAINAYNDILESYPVFYVTGEVKSRDPFTLWGIAFSVDASPNHPGYLTSATNIIVDNPDSSLIWYNQYVQAPHYYYGSTTGKGIFGQDVPVHVFGGPPNEVAQAENKLANAQSKASKAEDNLFIYINNYYEPKIKKNPSDNLYAQHAVSLINAAILTDNESQIEIGFAKINKYIKNPLITFDLVLHIADITMGWDERIAEYENAVDIDPFIVLNHAQSNEQFYFAGVALNNKGYKDYAILAFKMSENSSNDSIKQLSKQMLKSLGD